MERILRKLIPKLKLYNSKSLVRMYEQYAKIRYRNQFDNVVRFRGADFIIGQDVTLFPSVYLGTYEKTELDFLLSANIKDDGVIWDVGANIGLYSVLFAKRYRNVKSFHLNPTFNFMKCSTQISIEII